MVKLVSITPDAVKLIAYCARVSNPANQDNEATAPKLIKYLINHKHWSPFEMAHMTVEVTVARAISRQILRHWSFRVQEFSQRYAEVKDYQTLSCRLQDPTNRQNSIECYDPELIKWWLETQDQVWDYSYERYVIALNRGVAKEVARALLPEGLTQSTLYVNASLRSWIHYCQLRNDESTQLEHRQIAQQCRDILLQQCPELGVAFEV